LNDPIFAESAVEIIHASSQGIPRIINQICQQAYYSAKQSNMNVIEEKHSISVMADLDKQRGLKN